MCGIVGKPHMNFIPILHTPILSPRNWDASGFRSREISGDAYSPLYFHVRSLFFHLIGFSSHSVSRWQPGNGKWRQQIKTKGKKRRNGEKDERHCRHCKRRHQRTWDAAVSSLQVVFNHFIAIGLRKKKSNLKWSRYVCSRRFLSVWNQSKQAKC